jgi:hypothetical protein
MSSAILRVYLLGGSCCRVHLQPMPGWAAPASNVFGGIWPVQTTILVERVELPSGTAGFGRGPSIASRRSTPHAKIHQLIQRD